MQPVVDPETGLVTRDRPATYPVGPSSIAALIDDFEGRTDGIVALTHGGEALSYPDLHQAVRRAITAITDLGVSPGDRLAWTLPNCIELPVGFLACARLGVVWVGINTALADDEQRRLAEDAGAAHHVSDLDAWRTRLHDATPAPTLPPTPDPMAPAAIAYTSGTTGRPKGAVHSQHGLLGPAAVSIEVDPPIVGERSGTPLAHTILNMMVLGPLTSFVRGTTAVVLDPAPAAEFARAIERDTITRTMVVPTNLHDLVESSDATRTHLRSLRSIVVGGAGSTPELRTAFEAKFGVRPVPSYGLSEAPTGVVRDGTPLPHVEVTASNDGEILIGPVASGRWARCFTPMLGYWRQPAATETALAGGLLHTGDVGGVRDDGSIFVLGRRDETIVRGGANVSPAEVEQVIRALAGVRDVVVFGVDDLRLGQRVVAAVVGDVDVEALRAAAGETLARYKVPDELRVFDSVPRTALGKIDRSELQRRWEAAAAD